MHRTGHAVTLRCVLTYMRTLRALLGTRRTQHGT